jgi:hypothetical protein
MHLQCRIRSICKGCTTSIDAYADAADQVAHAHGKSGPEQRVSGEDVGGRVDLLDVVDLVEFRGEDDGHDDAVNGDNFAEDDGDQVLRSYPGCLDTSTENRDTCCPDSPAIMSERVPSRGSKGRTKRSLRRRGRCTARFPSWPMCMARRFRGIVRPRRC